MYYSHVYVILWDMKSINWTFIVVALILGAAVMGYGGFDYLKERDLIAYAQTQADTRSKQIEQNKKDLDACIENVRVRSNESWDKLCEAKGLKKDCLQPMEIVTSYDERIEFARNECYKKHTIK